ncbi:MAG: hypothetical protein ABIJ34_00970 [archaeon]
MTSHDTLDKLWLNLSQGSVRFVQVARDNPDITISAVVGGLFFGIRSFKPEWTLFPDVINHLTVPIAATYFSAAVAYKTLSPALEYSIEGQGKFYQAIARTSLLFECALLGYFTTTLLGEGVEFAQDLGIIRRPEEITNGVYQFTSNLNIVKYIVNLFSMYTDDKLADLAVNDVGGKIGAVLFGVRYAFVRNKVE